MADENTPRGNIYSANDALDINELASLNDDITPEFIEQLQNKVAQNANKFTGREFNPESSDADLFEEISPITTNENNEEQTTEIENVNSSEDTKSVDETNLSKDNQTTSDKEQKEIAEGSTKVNEAVLVTNNEIENLTSGNIIEKPATQKQIDYNNSLDYLDNNTKYSKYIIYINPENTEFIESLTVKERKNLINRLLREQDDIAITKRRLSLIQTIIKHSIIAIITITLTIPIIYWTINASLEASINNYRRSKVIFKTLYKEKGKIKKYNQY